MLLKIILGDMEKRLKKRLQGLKTEYESGQKVLAELEAKQASVRDTLLRISGAIQVLEEELANAETETSPASIPDGEESVG